MHKILTVTIATSLLLAACGSGSVQKTILPPGKKHGSPLSKTSRENCQKR